MTDQRAPTPPPRRPWVTALQLGVLGIMGLSIALVLIQRSGGTTTETPAPITEAERLRGATEACQQGIQDRLKDPYSAKWEGQTTKVIDAKTMSIAMQVRAKNSLGAYDLGKFVCSFARARPDAAWMLASVATD
jgi:hypothetical protein